MTFTSAQGFYYTFQKWVSVRTVFDVFNSLTQFDGKPWRKLHLNKLSELVEVFKGSDDLQNIQ